MRKQQLFLQFSECHASGGVSIREYAWLPQWPQTMIWLVTWF